MQCVHFALQSFIKKWVTSAKQLPFLAFFDCWSVAVISGRSFFFYFLYRFSTSVGVKSEILPNRHKSSAIILWVSTFYKLNVTPAVLCCNSAAQGRKPACVCNCSVRRRPAEYLFLKNQNNGGVGGKVINVAQPPCNTRNTDYHSKPAGYSCFITKLL